MGAKSKPNKALAPLEAVRDVNKLKSSLVSKKRVMADPSTQPMGKGKQKKVEVLNKVTVILDESKKKEVIELLTVSEEINFALKSPFAQELL